MPTTSKRDEERRELADGRGRAPTPISPAPVAIAVSAAMKTTAIEVLDQQDADHELA